ncbi:hypothetical protein E2542_SST06424 [Spatholobus suberectus]|nr:hypothetical protein E2542_SST06424 [Spatholobus suberectus]
MEFEYSPVHTNTCGWHAPTISWTPFPAMTTLWEIDQHSLAAVARCSVPQTKQSPTTFQTFTDLSKLPLYKIHRRSLHITSGSFSATRHFMGPVCLDNSIMHMCYARGKFQDLGMEDWE